MKKVSVIVPVHNKDKYLSSCLKSLVNQTETSLEILAIHDHSTDQSFEILKAFEKMYPYKIKVIDMKDKFGVSAARNLGVSYADGEFIGFVDADDIVSVNMFKDYYNAATEYHKKVVVGCFFPIPFDALLDYKDYSSSPITPRIVNYLQRESAFFWESPAVWDKLYEHSLIEDIPFIENHIYEDQGFTYAALLKAQEVVNYPRGDYLYRKTPNSIMTTAHQMKASFLDIIGVCYETFQSCDQWNFSLQQKKMLCDIFKKKILKFLNYMNFFPLSPKERVEIYWKYLSIANFYFPHLFEFETEYAKSLYEEQYVSLKDSHRLQVYENLNMVKFAEESLKRKLAKHRK